MLKFLFIIVGIAAAGLYMCASDSSKDAVKKAGTELVRDAADHAKEAALDQTEKAGKKMISRVKEIRKENDSKLRK
jgi:hypothetical protein